MKRRWWHILGRWMLIVAAMVLLSVAVMIVPMPEFLRITLWIMVPWIVVIAAELIRRKMAR